MSKTKPEEKVDNITTTASLGLTQPEIHLDASETQKEVEASNETISVVPLGKNDKLVEIKSKDNGRIYVGNSWYYFKAGETAIVPKNVADILTDRDALLPL
jgi:hypothetical protein